jgi:uncharacterized protein YdcH (DUF465 family)
MDCKTDETMIKELKEVVAEFKRLENVISQRDAKIKRMELNSENKQNKEIRDLKKQINLLRKVAETSDFEICNQCGGEGGFYWQTDFDAGGEECPKCLGACTQKKIDNP